MNGRNKMNSSPRDLLIRSYCINVRSLREQGHTVEISADEIQEWSQGQDFIVYDLDTGISHDISGQMSDGGWNDKRLVSDTERHYFEEYGWKEQR